MNLPDDRTLPQVLQEAARSSPETLAVVGQDRSLTYEQLAREAAWVAAGIPQMSSRPVVALYLPMCPAFVSALFGVLRAGRAALPLNLLLPPRDLGPILADAGADLVVTLPGLMPKLAGLPARVAGVGELLAQTGAPLPLEAGPALQAESLAVLLYTSGTTGQPKGVELTHHNLLANTTAALDALEVVPTDRFLACLPTFHTFALTATIFVPLVAGASLATVARFEPEAVLRVGSQTRCSALIMVPSMFRILTRQQERSRVPMKDLRLAIAGGEPLPDEVRQTFERTFGVPLLEGYGQTETSPIIAFNLPRAHRPGTVGRPLRTFPLRIVDPETGEEMPAGQTGEIWTKGAHVMSGYHNRPQETAAVLRPDGWLRTGDVGWLDADGYLMITGRLREIIKVAGEPVFPAEVESALLSHPAVSEAGVAGVPDERHGECVKAVVALQPGKTATAAELLAHCRTLLALYKVPKVIEFRKELPKNFTGKVLRRALK
jgi:long-chain acyl-CoA synthetase